MKKIFLISGPKVNRGMRHTSMAHLSGTMSNMKADVQWVSFQRVMRAIVIYLYFISDLTFLPERH